MSRRKKGRPAWTPFVRATSTRVPEVVARRVGKEALALIEGEEVWVNSQYTVHVTRNAPNGFGMEGVVWLSIKNNEKSARHDWREFQRIKNELTDPECDAVEVYPKESRLHDTADQFHLWVFPADAQFPVGFTDRAVSDNPNPGGSQRPFERAFRPADCMTVAEFEALDPITSVVGNPTAEGDIAESQATNKDGQSCTTQS